jgi:hypothetical protein
MRIITRQPGVFLIEPDTGEEERALLHAASAGVVSINTQGVQSTSPTLPADRDRPTAAST